TTRRPHSLRFTRRRSDAKGQSRIFESRSRQRSRRPQRVAGSEVGERTRPRELFFMLPLLSRRISAGAPKSTREARMLPRRSPGAPLCHWQIFARMAERACHPHQFVEKFLHATAVSWIGHFASRRIKQFSCRTEVNVRENRNEAELAQNRQQTLDHARAAKWTC